MNIEELWDGAYKGLYGEVVTEDIYRIRQLKFIPDVIFDLGANVGTFSRFARELFPESTIIAVEPDDQNIEYFHRFNESLVYSIIIYQGAIGSGEIFRCNGAVNGAHEVYASKGLGFEHLEESDLINEANVQPIILEKFCKNWIRENEKYMLKIDIEGAETHIFEHEPSMEVLRNADYIAMELHYHALDGDQLEKVKEFTLNKLDSLKETHYTEHVHPMFYATKKL